MSNSRSFAKRVVQSIVAFIVASCISSAQVSGGGGDANPDLKTNKESLKKWQDMRFGMFIHWGPVTLRGTEIGWSRGTQVSIDEYNNLYKEFNPVLFDAKEWVAVAKATGMKYLVITSKHHDGFCLWDSKYTDYKITSSPFRRDVLKELSDECARQGIMFCTYYSILDWHHPDYTTRYGGDKRPVAESDMNVYKKYLKNQIAELARDYHTNLLWFDGQWEKSWTHQDGMDLYAYARGLNDALLINNRVDKGRSDSKGMTGTEQFAGDFGTPEQEVGAFDNQHPWESCITICGQWSWKPNDRMKSLKESIHLLTKTAGGGGNLLFNVSPMLDGRIELRQQQRLREMGEWLKKYGESIYGTHGGPFKPTAWLASTFKDNKIYVHLLVAPKDELRLASIPGRTIRDIRILGGQKLDMKPEGGQLVVKLPAAPMDENAQVIVIELDGPAEGIEPLDVPKNTFKELESSGIKLKSPPSPTYAANGASSLVDKVRGTEGYLDGRWLGYEQEDFETIVDLQTARAIRKVVVGCLQTQVSWIFFPKGIDVSVSENGTDFTPAGKITTNQPKEDEDVRINDFTVSFEQVYARYVKIKVLNVGTCPDWHNGAGGKAWVFVDELMIE